MILSMFVNWQTVKHFVWRSATMWNNYCFGYGCDVHVAQYQYLPPPPSAKANLHWDKLALDVAFMPSLWLLTSWWSYLFLTLAYRCCFDRGRWFDHMDWNVWQCEQTSIPFFSPFFFFSTHPPPNSSNLKQPPTPDWIVSIHSPTKKFAVFLLCAPHLFGNRYLGHTSDFRLYLRF